MTTTTASTCRSCHAPITWGESGNGKRTPFNPDGSSHFQTCPDARTWSSRSSASSNGSAAASTTGRDSEIRRLACLKAAAAFAAGKALNTEVSTADVLKVAEAFERWVLRGD